MTDAIEVKVPDIGDFSDVEIIEVLVNRGDEVQAEDPLMTLETDKAAMDVPAPEAGRIAELKVGVGDRVSEGDVIATMEPTGAGRPATGAEASESDSEAESEPEPEPRQTPDDRRQTDEPTGAATSSDDVASQREEFAQQDPYHAGSQLPPIDEKSFSKAHASPAVRKFARELGVDLGRVSGSGVKGRITKEDVQGFVKSVMRSGGAPASGGGLPQVPTVDFARFGEVERKSLPRIRKIAGPRLQAAWINIPHVTQHDEADITDLETVRKALKSDAAKESVRLTPLAFLVKAAVHCLKEFPEFNSSLDPDGEHLVYKKYFHIGFAVDTPGGLVVPVIRDADTKSLFEIARELGELGEKARENKLFAADMQGGCFTISSLGSIGGTAFTPIVNAPEVAILGVSKADVRPVWDGEGFQPRTMLPLSLSYDHRVIDGAAAVRFTRFMAGVLEEVRELVL